MNANHQARRRGMGTHGAGQSAMPAQAAAPCVPVPVLRNSNDIAWHGHGMGGEQNCHVKARPPRRPPHAPTVQGMSTGDGNRHGRKSWARRGMGTHGADQSGLPTQAAAPCVPVPGPRAIAMAWHGHGMGGEQNCHVKARPPRRPPHAPTVQGMSHRRGDMLPPVVTMNADHQARRRGMGTHGAGQSGLPTQDAAPCVPRAQHPRMGNAERAHGVGGKEGAPTMPSVWECPHRAA